MTGRCDGCGSEEALYSYCEECNRTPRYGGNAEVAAALGVSGQTVVNWARRHKSFPRAVTRFRMGAVWDIDEVLRWKEKRDGVRDHQAR